jgi:hypothetical protein
MQRLLTKRAHAPQGDTCARIFFMMDRYWYFQVTRQPAHSNQSKRTKLVYSQNERKKCKEEQITMITTIVLSDFPLSNPLTY